MSPPTSTTMQGTPPLATTKRLPDFIIIGAAKSGTSTLTDYFRLHPRICVSRIKEPEFFAVDSTFARGMDWYHDLFAAARENQLCCEASTGYTRWPQYPKAAERIAQTIPHAKLIYLMRHPIDRAYSHYVHRVTKEMYPGQPIRWTFDEHVKNDPMCIDGSRYMDQIEPYLQYFSKDQFLFLFTDELQRDAKSVLSCIWRFLEIEAIELSDKPIVSNETSSQRDGRIRAYTTGPLKAVPGVRAISRLFPQSWRDGIYQRLQRSPYGGWQKRRYTPPPMPLETRRRLVEEFRAPNDRLAKFLGVDLSHWSR